MIYRLLQKELAGSATKLPVVAILGPRQSGKTTLAKATFSQHLYVSLEDLDVRQRAIEDPRKFLFDLKNENSRGIILDEFQHVPALLSYIQTIVDYDNRPGYFILTGSQNFLMSQEITQTLAGRIALLTLLPLSIGELQKDTALPSSVEATIFKGMYPRVYAHHLDPVTWYRDYIETCLERDVRQISKVNDLLQFKYFTKLCAGRIGQILNYASLASDCAIDVRTVKEWISILEASFIIFMVHPHHQHFNRRLVKSPKLYFYDTGLVCSLLNIESSDQLLTHYLRGNLFECLMVSDLYKLFFNKNRRPHIFFWRDNHGHEIDCIVENASTLIPIEIKANMTAYPKLFDALQWWYETSGQKEKCGYVIYGGDENQSRSLGNMVSWKRLEEIVGLR